MAIDIIDESGEGSDQADLRRMAEFLLANLGLGEAVELSIALVDEERMSQLHEQWLDEPGPTDVLSVPMDELREPADGQLVSGMLGDVIICPVVAARQAQVAGHQTVDELRILLAHGVLHLLGNDHADPEEARAMFARQGDLLDRYRAELAE